MSDFLEFYKCIDSWVGKSGLTPVYIEISRKGDGTSPVSSSWKEAVPVEEGEIQAWIETGSNVALLPGSAATAVLTMTGLGSPFPIGEVPDDALVVSTGDGGFQVYLDLLGIDAALWNERLGHEPRSVPGGGALDACRYVLVPPSVSMGNPFKLYKEGSPIEDLEFLQRVADLFRGK